jgi:hypothetical protein
MRKSSARGARTSAEVLGLTPHALWILVGGKEYMLDFARFPWFRTATIAEACDFTVEHGYHLHWPRLDIDLHLEGLEYPERFPLLSKVSNRKSSTKSGKRGAVGRPKSG